MKTLFHLSLLALPLLAFTGCDDDEDLRPALDVPETYAFTRDGQSTVSFSGQSTRIAMAEELNDALLDFDRSEDELDDMFRNPADADPFGDPALNASTKSLRGKVAASNELFADNTAAAAAIRQDFDGWIARQVEEVFPARNQAAGQGTAGQLADGSSVRYVSAEGYEYNQFFTKSLIGALMYDQLANNYLSPNVLDRDNNRADNDAGTLVDDKPYTAMEHFWDEAYGYVFGASADPADGLADLEDADSFLNKYLGRVNNDPDFNDTAATVEEAFRRGRAAIVEGRYEERNAQADRIRQTLVRVFPVRAVYYLQQAKLQLESQPVNYGGVFHDLSEAYGFLYSLRFTAGTDGTVATGLSEQTTERLLNTGDGGFWTLTPADLDALSEDVAAAYGIDVAAAGSTN